MFDVLYSLFSKLCEFEYKKNRGLGLGSDKHSLNVSVNILYKYKLIAPSTFIITDIEHRGQSQGHAFMSSSCPSGQGQSLTTPFVRLTSFNCCFCYYYRYKGGCRWWGGRELYFDSDEQLIESVTGPLMG